MFLGKYQHFLDNKGRLTIPARFRQILLEKGAYVTQGFDHNLMVLPATAFEAISQRIQQMSITDPMARLLRRLIFSSGEQVEVDKAGRILIPQYLREAVDLDGEAILIGSGEYFEIWSPEAWREQDRQIKDSEANSQRFAIFDLISG